ncbi:MAG: cysteine--tRNA ligase [Candidatus Saccharimonadales bacterium]
MKLYSTLNKQVTEFKPLAPGRVKMFVCGPTVYELSHIGHAKTYIQMDVLARTLRRLGYELTYLQNITDIDDRIITRAWERSEDWRELANHFEAEYLKDMTTLNNMAVDTYARATDHIDDIIRQVEALMTKGHAYEIADDGIYFEIATFPDYGKLSGRQQVGEHDSQARIDQSEHKRGWNDFCLWKFHKPNEPAWDAPFGKGRPGWHIEDTAISEHYFGPQYDIHGGAIDLIFPHHEAELTQMEAISGLTPFVGYWTHTGFLQVDEEKMSKSLDNFYTIQDVVDRGYDPMSLRLAVLQSHYRSPINFTWDTLKSAHTRLMDLRAMADLRWQLYKDESANSDISFDKSSESFLNAMANDLNSPQALAQIANDERLFAQNLISESQQDGFINYLQTIDDVLGLGLLSSSDITEEQKELLQQREHARTAADWKAADLARDELAKHNLAVRDTPKGQVWART